MEGMSRFSRRHIASWKQALPSTYRYVARSDPVAPPTAAKAQVDVCVKIAPDGSITIAIGMPGELNGDAANPWDEAITTLPVLNDS
jgi:hypothetical protein